MPLVPNLSAPLIRPAAAGTLLFGLFLAGCSPEASSPSPPNPSPSAQPLHVWVEAESAVRSDFPPPEANPFQPATPEEAALLSGGAWIGVQEPRTNLLSAEFAVTLPANGAYDLYARKFWRHGPFRWRVDNLPWQTNARDTAILDAVRIRRHLAATWVRAGSATAPAGAHTLRVELLETNGAACFDAFCFTTGTAAPRGPFPPGGRFDRAPEGWFPFEPANEPAPDAQLDLRSLNHRFAGEFGRVIRKGDALACEKRPDEPLRLFGVTLGDDALRLHDAAIARHARLLAALGVNQVRFHLDYEERAPGPKLDRVHRWVAELKANGIYSGIGFFCTAVARIRPEWNFAPLEPPLRPIGLLFYYPPMQELYKAWARTLFSTPNPHTGLPLARDPALAWIEMIDEDSLFFWTFNPGKNHPAARAVLEREFGAWAAAKFGSPAKALAAWGPEKAPAQCADSPDEGRLGLYPIALLTSQPWAAPQRNEGRARAQAEFLTARQSAFWRGMARFFREELQCPALLYGSNWRTADPRNLDALNRLTTRELDLIARNDYFGPAVEDGPLEEFPFGEGAMYRDQSILTNAASPVVQQVQEEGFPFLWTEGGWFTPNRFRAEMPLFTAAYFSHLGVDGMTPFVLEPGWATTLPKWPVLDAACAAQFPAAALIYRLGLVQESPVLVRESLNATNLFALEGGLLDLDPAIADTTQSSHVPAGARAAAAPSPGALPFAFLAGKVVRRFHEGPPALAVDPRILELIDPAAGRVRNATGELDLDQRAGLLRINTPRAQGIAGFTARAGSVRLADATFASGAEFACLVLVALDDQPLAASRRMLLQAMTEDANFGAATAPTPDGRLKIMSLGRPPVVVREISGSVTLHWKGAAALHATALDFDRRAAEKVALEDGRLNLLPNRLYYLIEKESP